LFHHRSQVLEMVENALKELLFYGPRTFPLNSVNKSVRIMHLWHVSQMMLKEKAVFTENFNDFTIFFICTKFDNMYWGPRV
jgi:hypothetical protein